MNMGFKRMKLYVCCFVLLVSLVPVGNRSYADTIDDMLGSTLPAGTVYTASGSDGASFEPKNIGDGDWYSLWRLSAKYARLQMEFPEPVHMKAVQFATGSIGKRYETYIVEGLQNGQWSRLGKKTYTLDPQGYVALAPIQVAEGWYDGIRVIVQSTRPSLMINELHYISGQPAPSGLQATYGDQQVKLGWKPVNGADGYRIRYGNKSGTYTATLDVSADTYGGLTVPNLQNGHAYYFAVAALHGGVRSNYSDETFTVPVAGLDFPSYRTLGSNGEWYMNPVSHTLDRNMSTSWRYSGSSSAGELYYEFFYPVYINELQLTVTAAQASDLTYTVYKGRGAQEQILAQRQLHVEGSQAPFTLEAFPITPGWYNDMNVRIHTSAGQILVNEVRYTTDHTPVNNVQVTGGNAQLTLSWEPIAGAEQYRIVYGKQYGNIAQTSNVTVSDDAYNGYTLNGLMNDGSPYYILVQAIVNGEAYGYSEVATGTPLSYEVGDFLPLTTQVTGSGAYDNHVPAYAADHNLQSFWMPESGEHKNGTINFSFTEPIDIYAIQPVSTVSPAAPHHYTVYGLQGRDWVLLYDGPVQIPYNPSGGIVAPIPITPGQYDALMLTIDASPNWLTLQELLVFYNQPVGSVTTDTYGIAALPTVGEDTYK